MRKVIVLIALLLLLALSGPVNAEQMAIWDFGPDAAHYTHVVTAENVIGTPTLSFSGDDFDTNGKDGIGYLDAAGVMHLSGQSAAWNDVSGTVSDAEWVMTINTIGFQDMAIRWNYLSDATGSNQGPTSFDFSFRVGTGGWVPVLNNEAITRDDNWHVFSYDLSSITAIEGQSSVQFRVDDLNRNDLDGAYMFDNLELTGVPEPCSIALLGIGVLTALTRKRRLA